MSRLRFKSKGWHRVGCFFGLALFLLTVSPSGFAFLLNQDPKLVALRQLQKKELRELEMTLTRELKEFQLRQKRDLRNWEMEEKQARHRYFQEHLRGAERRDYVQSFLKRRKALYRRLKQEEKTKRESDQALLNQLLARHAEATKELEKSLSTQVQ